MVPKRVTIQVRASKEDQRALRRLQRGWDCSPSEAIRRAILQADEPFRAQLSAELALKEQERAE